MSKSILNTASGNNFQLFFPVMPFSNTIKDSRDLTLHIFGSVLPGVTLDVSPASWQGFETKRADGTLTFADLRVDFVVDENLINWLLIFNWMQNINNNKDKAGNDPKIYAADANIIMYNNYNKPIAKFKLIDVFPYDLTEATLSYRDGESYLESSCSFAYTRFEIEKVSYDSTDPIT